MDYTKNIFEKKGGWSKFPKSGALNVSDIHVDKRGFVWTGGTHLDCTIGKQTKDIHKEVKLEIPFHSNGFSREDKWWGLTNDARLLSIDLETLEVTDHTDRLPCLDEAYWLWTTFCHEDVLIGLPNKLIRYDSKKAVVIDVVVNEEFRLNHATISPKGEIWFTNNLGVNRYDGKKIHTFTLEDLGIDCKVWEIIVTRENVAWVGSQEEGIFKIAGDFSSYSKLESGLARYVPAIPLFEDREGNVWLRFRAHSIACVTEYGIVHFTTEDGISSPNADSVSEDAQGKLWFAYLDAGIGVYDAVNLVEIAPFSIHSTFITHDNSCFLGTPTNGVLLYKDDKLSVISKNIACEARSSINYLPPNKVIIHNPANRECRIIDTNTGEILSSDKLLMNFNYSVFCEGNGVLWLTSETHLIRMEGEQHERFSYDDLGFKSGRHVFLFENFKGNLCIICRQFGLIKVYSKGKFKDYNRILPSCDSHITAALEDHKGRLWLGCSEGEIFCCKSTKFEKVDFPSYLPSFKITCMLEDSSGNILIGSNIGLYIYDGTIRQKIASHSHSLEERVTGLSLLEDNDILISTVRGAFRYRQNRKIKPQISILKAVADKEYISPSSLQIHSGVPFCNIHFGGVNTKIGDLKYLYRLKGYDDEWKQTWNRNVRFDELPVGDYEFQIQSVDVDLIYSEEVASISIHVAENPEKEHIQQLEGELKQTKDFSDNIIRSIHEAIIVLDLDGVIKMVNYAAMNLLEYSQPDIEGMHISDLMFESDKPLFNKKGIKELLKHGVLKNQDCKMVTLEGKIIQALVSGSLMCNKDGDFDGIVLVVTDMTAYHELQQQLNRKQKMESLGVIAGGIAHDFNNLLGVIIGNTDLLRLNLPDNSENLKYTSDVITAAERAAKLCSSLLDYTGKSFVVKNEVNLSALVEQLSDLLRSSISNKIDLDCSLDSSLPPILAGESQIDQVVLNLITNASEAIGDNYGCINVTTRSEKLRIKDLVSPYLKDVPTRDGVYVILEVSDTGCGMDEEMIAHIFEPFFTSKFTGRGLGLAAVHGIIHSLHGSLKVKSNPGEGTTFTVLLPASQDDSVAETNLKVSLGKTKIMGEGKVLFVEDEGALAVLGRHMLEQIGFSVILAVDGFEAVQKFEELKDELTVVLMDNTMPRMDGKEALERMHEISKDVPIIMSSGYSETSIKKQFQDYDKVDFLHKPYNLNELMDALHKVGALN